MHNEATRACPGHGSVPDGRDLVLDSLDRAFHQLRRSLVRPTLAQVAIPSLGHRLDLAKVQACEAVFALRSELTTGSVSVKDVAELLHLEHSTVSRLVVEVEAEGLLVRGVDAADRRRTTLELTPSGRAVVEDAHRMRRFLMGTVVADWDDQDLNTLATLLSKFAEDVAGLLTSLPGLARAEFCSEVNRVHMTPPQQQPPHSRAGAATPPGVPGH